MIFPESLDKIPKTLIEMVFNRKTSVSLQLMKDKQGNYIADFSNKNLLYNGYNWIIDSELKDRFVIFRLKLDKKIIEMVKI